MLLFEQALLLAHLLSGAAWFGALVYRTFFVDPKAKAFFAQVGQFEHFSLKLAHGMRYVVMLALVVCGISGFCLLGLKWQPAAQWQMLMYIKIGIWLLAFAIFAYISWVFWPYRVFATAEELPVMHNQGFVLAFTMIVLSALGLALGQLAKSPLLMQGL